MTAAPPTQTAANHARYVPGFHFVALSLALLNVIWTASRVFTRPGADSAMALLPAVALLLVGWYARQFAVTVQDRVIRLEEQLRLARLLPPDLRTRVDEFTPSQLVALRFASDAELPALAQRVLTEKVSGRAAIKAMIRDWRPDHLRA
jgi:Family of unknown function (DUF6526)